MWGWWWLGAAALVAAPAPAPPPEPTPASVVALPSAETAGVGATLPFVEHEAEAARTNGRVIGPDRRFTTLPSEASGRRAVLLDAPGRYVEFTLARAANALTIRYAVPDTPDGRGLDATLSVHAGERIGVLRLTSRYGWFYGAYPFTNRPADGKGHHFYDHARLLLGRTLPAGTTVRLMVGPGDRAPWYAIDLADFQLVPPPRPRPPGSVSVLDHGADPKGVRDSLPAFRAALVAAGDGGVLWVPPGRFRLPGRLMLDRVEVAGAGTWHTALVGEGVGLYGRAAPRPSTDVHVHDLAIIGEVTERVDHLQLNGVGGAMSRSRLHDLFIQHVKVGIWFDGPMEDVRLSRLCVFDVTADGLNFHRGVRRAVLEDSLFRSTGDDGIAAWSGGVADRDVVIRRNTVVAPVLANGIAIYGGRDILVERNLVADTLTQGGGLHLGNRFKATPFKGHIRLAGNIVVRGGSFDPNWRFGVGALWFYALDAPIRARIAVTGTRLIDSSEEGILFIGHRVDGVMFNSLMINVAGGPAITARTTGSAVASQLTVVGAGGPNLLACPAFHLLVTDKAKPMSRASLECQTG